MHVVLQFPLKQQVVQNIILPSGMVMV